MDVQFQSIEAFVPSGKDFEGSKQLFLALGFHINWEVEGYAGFQKDNCRFILQHYEKEEFAHNFMLSVKVTDLNAYRDFIVKANIPEKFGVRISEIIQQSYGKELNLIDIAGVCWHFVEQ